MTEDEYRSDPRPSITQLAKLDRMTPAHARIEWEKPPSKSMQFGTAFHALVLEPGRFDELVTVAPAPINPRTGEPYGVGTKAHDEWLADNAVPGKTLITTVQHEAMQAMADSVSRLDIASLLTLDASYLVIEQPVFGSLMGVECKGRPDLRCWANLGSFSPLILDLKTTSGKATEEEFQRSMVEYGYGFQAAGYSMLAAQHDGFEYRQFVFVVAETQPPYGAAAFRLDPGVIDWYRHRVLSAAATWPSCRGGELRCHPTRTQDIRMPRWHESSRASTGDNT